MTRHHDLRRVRSAVRRVVAFAAFWRETERRKADDPPGATADEVFSDLHDLSGALHDLRLALRVADLQPRDTDELLLHGTGGRAEVPEIALEAVRDLLDDLVAYGEQRPCPICEADTRRGPHGPGCMAERAAAIAPALRGDAPELQRRAVSALELGAFHACRVLKLARAVWKPDGSAGSIDPLREALDEAARYGAGLVTIAAAHPADVDAPAPDRAPAAPARRFLLPDSLRALVHQLGEGFADGYAPARDKIVRAAVGRVALHLRDVGLEVADLRRLLGNVLGIDVPDDAPDASLLRAIDEHWREALLDEIGRVDPSKGEP